MPAAADRILVVEDDDDSRAAIADLLMLHGYDVVTARNGVEAVALVESQAPSLVLSDVRMPGIDGFRLVEQLRQRTDTTNMPIILLSGLAERRRRVAGLDLGADDYLAKPVDSEELLARIRVHLRHARRQQELERRTQVDPLTGVLNRAGLYQVLHHEHERALRTGARLSCLLIDVDGFKQLNDTYGHPAGDAVLQSIARALTSAVRAVDHVGRLGGDEFVVVVPDGDEPAAAALAQRLAVLAIPAIEVDSGTTLQIKLSVGVATLRAGETVDGLIERADQAMYRRKRLARGSTPNLARKEG